MRNSKRVIKRDSSLFLVLFIGLAFALQGQKNITLHAKDKISFIGNSITQDGRYHMILQSYLTTRYPDLALEVYNNGISGDVADGVLYRFEKDILALKPDYAFLMLGMNDIQRQLYAEGIDVTQEILNKREEALAHYYQQTTHIVALLKEHDIKPIFLTPTIYDQTAKIDQVNDVGCNEALAKCAAHIRMLALENKAPLVNFYDYLNEINHTAQQKDSTFTIVGPDRIHPGDLGHFAMATKIITSVLDSGKLSAIQINAASNKIELATNCSISKLVSKRKNIKFDVIQEALPFPIADRFKEQETILAPLAINEETLTVKGLKQGNYQLQIDSFMIGEFSATSLASGIDLSVHKNTPQYLQALEVFKLCEAYHKIYGRLRIIALIEYKNLKDYTGPDTTEGKRIYLDQELEKQREKSWHSYLVKMCNAYFEEKPNETALWKQLTTIRNHIQDKSQPKTHTYLLHKTK